MALVALYLGLNVVVCLVGMREILRHSTLIPDWKNTLFAQHGNPLAMLGISLILFPKLALGLSGFETGVAVMPLIKADDPAGRVRNARKLLVSAAAITSISLMITSVITTLLIEPAQFKEGGEANGRALAYLAHSYLGSGFGSLYDLSTIMILAFAGASAMTGLLSLIPKYLPRFGMAPEWARASRPLVLVFMAVSLVVTLLFRANVDAQGGAYATGVLVLITSAAAAVTISLWKRALRWPFLLITLVFVYTTALNVYEGPEGLKIASIFIATMIVSSLLSRAMRSTELRICGIDLDPAAQQLLSADEDQIIRLVARRPRPETVAGFDAADGNIRNIHGLSATERVYFFELERTDASEFEETLRVTGERIGKHSVVRASRPVVANAIAALLVHLEKTTPPIRAGAAFLGHLF
ncbi:MAG: hypothetical protein JO323_12785 [Acidobacteriia bacterium]|nr:hypothetical protein [Terriglobia bacterium]